MVSIKVSIHLSSGAQLCYSTQSIEVSPGPGVCGRGPEGAELVLCSESPCQGEGRGFETRVPLHTKGQP
jgi:hypothetical protein